jgi:hypothetical protein
MTSVGLGDCVQDWRRARGTVQELHWLVIVPVPMIGPLILMAFMFFLGRD